MAANKKLSRPQKQGAQTKPNLRPTAIAPPTFSVTFFYPGFWKEHRFPILLLLAFAFVLYGTTTGFGYLMDDQLVIWDNMYVQKGLAGLWDIFAHDSFLGYFKKEQFILEGGRYRPLSLATFAAEISLFGKNNPGIAHFINVLLYGLNGILLYRILIGLFPVYEGGRWFFSLPFVSALIFTLHPLHVEVVANIKGRDEILALLGSLGALYASLKYFDTGKKRWWIGSGALLFLGLLAKENALTFLVVIPLTLYMLAKIPANRIAGATVPLGIASALFIIIRYNALGYMLNPGQSINDLMNNPFLGMSGLEKLATIFLTLGWYLKLLFIPYPLTHDYYPYHVPKVGWGDWRALSSLILYILLSGWALWRFRKVKTERLEPDQAHSRLRIPAYAILYFLLTISIVSNLIVSTGTFMNERFAYMPSVGFCLLLGWILTQKLPELLKMPPDRPNILGVGLLGVLAILFSIQVWNRVADWGGKGDGLVLSAVRHSEKSARANYYYGMMLYHDQYAKMPVSTDPATNSKNYELLAQIDLYNNRALEIYPDYRQAVTMKATVALARFRHDKQLDKLFNEFEMLIQKQPLNGDMLIVVLEAMKSLKGSNPNIYNEFCHRVGYNFYFKQRNDLNGALEFLNHGLNNFSQDQRILQDLVAVYTAMGNKAKVAELQTIIQALQKN